LISRSKYFENMFSCETLQENNNRVVDIKDFQYDDLMLLLIFIYSDNINLNISLKHAISLLLVRNITNNHINLINQININLFKRELIDFVLKL